MASTRIELLNKQQVLNIKALPWASEDFSKELSNNKINYINYWAQWCEPCLTEIPHLKKMTKDNPNLKLIFVNVDNKSNLEKAKKWWDENGDGTATYYPAFENKILKHTRGLPYHQVYNKNKDLVSHFTGNIEGKESLVQLMLKDLN